MCSLLCPMINKYGFCESAMRRVERVQECPHDRIGGFISPLYTKDGPEETVFRYPNDAAQGGWTGVSKHPAKLGVLMQTA